MKAKLGIDYFWVKKVEHSIFDFESEICIWLEGGFLNKYREFAFEKISFHEKIGVMAEYDLHRFEIDKIIKSWIRL